MGKGEGRSQQLLEINRFFEILIIKEIRINETASQSQNTNSKEMVMA